MVNNRQRFAAIRLVGLGTVTEQLGLSGVHTHTHTHIARVTALRTAVREIVTQCISMVAFTHALRCARKNASLGLVLVE